MYERLKQQNFIKRVASAAAYPGDGLGTAGTMYTATQVTDMLPVRFTGLLALLESSIAVPFVMS
jgi:hypothetical protein